MATAMVMEEKTMVKRRKRDDILEVARDDANATKKECSNVSVQEEKKYYTVSFDTSTGSYEYKIGKDGIIQERNYKRSNSEEVSTTEPVEETKKKRIQLLLMKINKQLLMQLLPMQDLDKKM